jgi:hypothetical protein
MRCRDLRNQRLALTAEDFSIRCMLFVLTNGFDNLQLSVSFALQGLRVLLQPL